MAGAEANAAPSASIVRNRSVRMRFMGCSAEARPIGPGDSIGKHSPPWGYSAARGLTSGPVGYTLQGMATRTLQRVIEAIPTSDGAGVKLRRSLGQSQGARLDPFLMLDHFSTENADDYIAGFPPHPHRGFETVTY